MVSRVGVHSVKCSNCAYGDDGPSPVNKEDGEWMLCRRRAPIASTAANDGYVGGDGIFPRVEPDDWCGEWVQNCFNTHQPKQMNFLEADLHLFHESYRHEP
jgi:hypothetical protein